MVGCAVPPGRTWPPMWHTCPVSGQRCPGSAINVVLVGRCCPPFSSRPSTQSWGGPQTGCHADNRSVEDQEISSMPQARPAFVTSLTFPLQVHLTQRERLLPLSKTNEGCGCGRLRREAVCSWTESRVPSRLIQHFLTSPTLRPRGARSWRSHPPVTVRVCSQCTSQPGENCKVQCFLRSGVRRRIREEFRHNT